MYRHEVGAALESLDQLRKVLRRLGEVALQQDHGVAPGVLVVGGHMPDQCIDAGRIATVHLAAEDGQRHHRLIRLEDLPRAIGARVVVDDHVVLPREALKHRSQAPEQDADGSGLVVDRDADAEHVGRVGGKTNESNVNLTSGGA